MINNAGIFRQVWLLQQRPPHELLKTRNENSNIGAVPPGVESHPCHLLAHSAKKSVFCYYYQRCCVVSQTPWMAFSLMTLQSLTKAKPKRNVYRSISSRGSILFPSNKNIKMLL